MLPSVKFRNYKADKKLKILYKEKKTVLLHCPAEILSKIVTLSYAVNKRM